MKEETAKTKWCPMVRFNVDTDALTRPPRNRGYGEDRCVASDCMMWVQTDNEGEPQPAGHKADVIYRAAGHCGLAK